LFGKSILDPWVFFFWAVSATPLCSSFLVHGSDFFTAGKDRTGVLAALLLSLAGASHSLIAYDYALTRVGVEPSREVLLQMLKLWNKEWTSETPGMQEFVQVRGEFILAFLDGVEARYGSVEGYLRDVLGFEDGEIGRMKGVLRGGSGGVECRREG
jgi:hypothetical protein